jgi:adhesin transport system outer membrane protein
LLLLGLSIPPAHAALTLEAALQSALDSHPAIAGKRSSLVAAKAETEGVKWQRYPTPSLELAGEWTQIARVDQPLWTGGRITAGIDAAGRREEAAAAAVDESQEEVGLRVITAWNEALRQQTRLAHAAAGVQEHEKLMRMIENRVRQEVSPPVDREFAQARLLQARNDQQAVKQALNIALTQLTQLIGKPVSAVLEPTAPVNLDAPLESALERITDRSPQLRRLAREEDAAAQDIVSRKSALYPQVSFRLEKSMGDVQYDRAMVVLTAQPGAGLSAASGVDAAVAKREAARLARETAQRELGQQVRVDWEEWQASRERLALAKEARAMTAGVAESYARQYTTGRKSWIDVLNAVRESTQADFTVADAAAQANAAALRLRLRLGLIKLEP